MVSALESPLIVSVLSYKALLLLPVFKSFLSVDCNFTETASAGNEEFPGRFPDFHRPIYNKAIKPDL